MRRVLVLGTVIGVAVVSMVAFGQAPTGPSAKAIEATKIEKVKDNLSCIRGDVKNLNTPSQHDHQAVARFPSPVYRLSLCILPDVAPCYKGIQGRIRKSPEESMAPQ